MKRSHLHLFAIALVSLFATNASALERALDRSTGGDTEWNSGGPCQTVQYWNSCVGWTWTWGGWSPGDRIGVNYTGCEGMDLLSVDIFSRFTNGVPVLPGYGFTATLEAFAADANGCLTGPSLGSAPFLPDGTTQNVAFVPSVVVPQSFAAVVTMGSGGSGSTRYGTDYDVAGPTGPQGCGLCFPTTRVSNSYYYGTATTALCPGSKLSVICEVEWRWTAHLIFILNVDDSSWGKIKGLYR